MNRHNAGKYPTFDVMSQKEHWDPHTRNIVEKRLNTEQLMDIAIFTDYDIELLKSVCQTIIADERQHIIQFIMLHIDKKLDSSIGEAQKKAGVPKASVLIRDGLLLLDHYCLEQFDASFVALQQKQKNEIIRDIANKKLEFLQKDRDIQAYDWFSKMITEIVPAYYSHPDVWSEIGYAGPAYPRGYVRSEWGLTDPWEAKKSD